MSPRAARLLTLSSAAAGLLFSAISELVHVRATLAAGVTSFCTFGETFDCDAVSLSPWAVVGGIPLPVWGIAGFVAVLVAAWRRSKLLLPLVALASLASIALFTLQLTSVGAICLLCEGVHLASLAAFAGAWWMRPLEPVPRDDVLSILLVPALVLAVLWTVLPRYWAALRWDDAIALSHGVDEDGRPWIGAETPVVTIVEVIDYACPHCARASARMRMLVESHPDAVRLVRAHQPRMRCRNEAACVPLRAALCAGQQEAFWRMDAWLFAHVPMRSQVDVTAGADALGLEREAFERCLTDERTLAQADTLGMQARRWGIVATPGYRIDGKRIDPSELSAVIEQKLDAARR